MPWKARVEFAGAAYHLLDRGDHREAIFRDERDREIFLTTPRSGLRTDRLAMVAGMGNQRLPALPADRDGKQLLESTLHRGGDRLDH
jgi:hypothetical protein